MYCSTTALAAAAARTVLEQHPQHACGSPLANREWHPRKIRLQCCRHPAQCKLASLGLLLRRLQGEDSGLYLCSCHVAVLVQAQKHLACKAGLRKQGPWVSDAPARGPAGAFGGPVPGLRCRAGMPAWVLHIQIRLPFAFSAAIALRLAVNLENAALSCSQGVRSSPCQAAKYGISHATLRPATSSSPEAALLKARLVLTAAAHTCPACASPCLCPCPSTAPAQTSGTSS